MDKLFYSYTGEYNKNVLEYSKLFPHSFLLHSQTHKLINNGNVYGGGGSGTIIFIEGSLNDTNGYWTGFSEEILNYDYGISLIYVPTQEGGRNITYLNINDLGNLPIYINNKYLTKEYLPGTPILLTLVNNVWKVSDFNSNILQLINETSSLTNSYYLTMTNSVNGEQYSYANSNLYYKNNTLHSYNFKGNLIGDVSGHAGSAYFLSYSYHINGTVFNGTKDITTAYWGYQRKFKINDYDNSNQGSYSYVDGSKDIILNLPNIIKANQFIGNLNGNSYTSDKWKNIRNISLNTKDYYIGSYITTIDGSKDINLYIPSELEEAIYYNEIVTSYALNNLNNRISQLDYKIFNNTSLSNLSWWGQTKQQNSNIIEGNIINTGYILPKTSLSYNIGSSILKYDKLYVNSTYSYLFGNVQGNVFGNVSGHAGSAYFLTYSYHINGTVFNGTKDITTAYWGYQRKFKINDYDNSNQGSYSYVDGSKDIIFNLPNNIKAYNFIGHLEGNANTSSRWDHNINFTIRNNSYYTGSQTEFLNGSSDFTLVLNPTLEANMYYNEIITAYALNDLNNKISDLDTKLYTTSSLSWWGQMKNSNSNIIEGNISNTGNILPKFNLSYNIGSNELRYSYIYGNLKGNADTSSRWDHNINFTIRNNSYYTGLKTEILNGNSDFTLVLNPTLETNVFYNEIITSYALNDLNNKIGNLDNKIYSQISKFPITWWGQSSINNIVKGDIKDTGDILPEYNLSYNIGSQSLKYNNVYSDNFIGHLTGNADTATKWLNTRNITVYTNSYYRGSYTTTIDGTKNIDLRIPYELESSIYKNELVTSYALNDLNIKIGNLSNSIFNRFSQLPTLWWGQQNINNIVEGDIYNTGNITPKSANIYDIGSSGVRYRYIYGDLKGNADTATKWLNTRNITLYTNTYYIGSYTTTIDGTKDINLKVPYELELGIYNNELVTSYALNDLNIKIENLTNSVFSRFSQLPTTWWGQKNINNTVKGDLVNANNITPDTDNIYNIGSSELRYKTIFGTRFTGRADTVVSEKNNTTKIYYIGVQSSNSKLLYDDHIYTSDITGNLHADRLFLNTSTENINYKLYVAGDTYFGIDNDNTSYIGSIYYSESGDRKLKKKDFTYFLNEIRDRDILTITKTLTANADTWIDTGITGDNISNNGTYIVQVYVYTGSTSPNFYNSYFSGIMSWFKDNVNGSGQTDEILLHTSSHANNSSHIYLRTISPSSSKLKLQVACDKAFTNMEITFKFRRMI